MSRGSDDAGTNETAGLDDADQLPETEADQTTDTEDMPNDGIGSPEAGQDDSISINDLTESISTDDDDPTKIEDGIATTSSSNRRQKRGRGRGRGRGKDDGPSTSAGGNADDSTGSNSPDDNSNGDQTSGRRQNRGRGGDRNGSDKGKDSIIGAGAVDQRGYRFDLGADGGIINLQSVRRGRYRTESIDAGESYTFVPAIPGDPTSIATLIRTEITAAGTEVKTFTDSNSDNVWTRISEVFTPASNPTV